MKRFVVPVLVAAAAIAVYASASALATPSTGLTTAILAKSTFGDLNLNAYTAPDAHKIPARVWQAHLWTRGESDIYAVDNKIAPGGTTGWHSHPGPSLIFVVAGTVTNYLGDDPHCTPHVYTAGSGFVDAGGSDVHTLRNEGSVQAETIAVQFLPKDAARKTDEPSPGNCPF